MPPLTTKTVHLPKFLNTMTGMPFGPYRDFDDCVRKNQDKDNPQAYCAALERIIKRSAGPAKHLPSGDGLSFVKET